MRIKGIIFGRDSLLVQRLLPGKLGRREVFYQDIEGTILVPPNGHPRSLLLLKLKEGKDLSIVYSSAAEAEGVKIELEEILSPKILRNGAALRFEGISPEVEQLLASKGANVRKAVDLLLDQAIRHSASDILIEPRDREIEILYRLDGVLQPIMRIGPEWAGKIVNCIKTAAGLLVYRKDVIQEGRIAFGSGRGHDLRVAVMPAAEGERVAIRLFDKLKGESGIDALGFSEAELAAIRTIALSPQGLFIVCGPASSGKTTTLYAMLRSIHANRGNITNIITLEDPVEYRIPGITQVQIEPARDLSFPRALMSSLRQDPGVIMVGEIRDRETAQAAAQAALTGHLVLSTIHSGSAAEGVARLMELGLTPHLVRSTLRGVLCQRLVRTLCRECAGRAGRECAACRGTGYSGRTVIAELLQMNEVTSLIVKEGMDTRSLVDAASGEGMASLMSRAEKLVSIGKTDQREITRVLG
jgi:general secretion pathway protein E